MEGKALGRRLMRLSLTGWLALWLGASAMLAEEIQLRVYSEFQRVDPYGRVVEVDRAAKPRELLSPAVARNGYFSYHIAVTAPARSMYFLAVQMYPPDALRWKLYEEKFAFDGKRWIPDALQQMASPYFGVVPDPEQSIPGQTTCVYLLDVFVPPETPPSQVRLEVLAKFDTWRMWPMEVRIPGASIPDLRAAPLTSLLPPLTDAADAAAIAVLRAYVEGREEAPGNTVRSVRSVIWRNAVQDAALARSLEARLGREQLRRKLEALPATVPNAGAERYLKVRDYLIREASR
jgi:hypothetical protein